MTDTPDEDLMERLRAIARQRAGRVRFSVYDMQASVNTSGRGIAEDIRALKSAPNKGDAS
jgi:hypothetical protein